jgi:hypothetical protein
MSRTATASRHIEGERLSVDSDCSRNTSELSRIDSEEFLQSLSAVSGNGLNCIGNAACLFAPYPRGSKVAPEMRQMIERVRINVISHGLNPLLIRNVDTSDRTLKHGAQRVDDFLHL